MPIQQIDELLEESALILDIAHDGVLLCGRGDYWQLLVKKAREYTARRRLVRTSAGRFPLAAQLQLPDRGRPLDTRPTPGSPEGPLGDRCLRNRQRLRLSLRRRPDRPYLPIAEC
ncbi:MAG: hypothetical protein ACP5I3_10905 [Thermoproteus sp.]